MTRVMSLSSLGGEVVLDGRTGIQAKAALRGTGLPPVSSEWFEGAGDGASFRGGRYLPRVMDVPIKVYGIDRAAVSDRLRLIGRIFDLASGPVRLAVELDGTPWYVDVRRTGGGDWNWDSDTDGRTFVKTILTVQAGDPFWIAADTEQRLLKPGGVGLGLLGPGVSLVSLTLSSSAGFGEVGFQNSGDVAAHAIWTIRAPFSAFTLISPTGDELVWGTAGDGVGGDVKDTGYVVVNTELGTATDETGDNVYSGFGPVPRFWPIPRGDSTATVTVDDADGDTTQVEVVWNARRWVMF